MNEKLCCPILGTWSQGFCSQAQCTKDGVSDDGCKHRTDCIELQKVISTNPNAAVGMVKRVLIEGVPNLFDNKG